MCGVRFVVVVLRLSTTRFGNQRIGVFFIYIYIFCLLMQLCTPGGSARLDVFDVFRPFDVHGARAIIVLQYSNSR